MPAACQLTTPLGPDVLLVRRCVATERLSTLGEAQLTLLSLKPDLSPDALLGKPVGLALALQADKPRHFHGYVTRFAQGGFEGRYHVYAMTLKPWLWLLTRTADCRIFQALTVPEIVKQVFDDHPIAHADWKLFRDYRKRTYCVQYRESDYAFVARLLESEGIYWHVAHDDGAHKLVLCDAAAAHDPTPGCETLPFYGAADQVPPELDHVSAWTQARGVKSGKVVLADYDFERPSTKLVAEQARVRAYDLSDAEVFDYPGGYLQADHGKQYAEDRLDELHAAFETFSGRSNAGGVHVGAKLALERHPRDDQNADYLVTATTLTVDDASHDAGTSADAPRYECRFDAIAFAQQFRPRRSTPRPQIAGPQTAVVTGPAGEELYTDAHGRVKVHFHWDRHQPLDETSSCWVRVSQAWAGKGWGGVSIPRIGQEVIVEFLEGDPDQPLVTGRVYNAEQSPPFGMPAAAMVSGIKSKTHKGQGFNELSMDDTAGKEKITIHGQYDMGTTVLHDQTSTVNNNRTDTVHVDDSETIGSNQTLKVGATQKLTVGADQHVAVVVNRTKTVGGTETVTVTGHRTETVNGGETVTVTGGRSHKVNGVQTTTVSLAEMHSVGAGRMHNVGAAEAITVGGAQMVNVGAAQMVSVGGVQRVNVGALQSIGVGGPHKLSAAAIGQTSKGIFKVKAAGTATVEAPTIVLKAGSSKIVLDSGGVTISGSKVTVKADGDVTLKAGGNVGMKAGGSIKQKASTIGEN